MLLGLFLFLDLSENEVLLTESPDVVGDPVDDDGDRQERPADDHAEREHVQRELVHHRRLRIGSRFRALPRDRCPAVEVGGDTGQDHQRDRDGGHRRTAEDRKGLQPMFLGHRRADRRSEQVGVEEVPDVGRAEEIVRQRAVLLHRQPEPADPGLRPVEGHQHVVQTQEHRDLREHRQAAEDRVEVVLALQLLDLQRHPLPVLAVLLLQGFDLGLELLHLPGGPDLLHERPVQHGPQREHQEHH